MCLLRECIRARPIKGSKEILVKVKNSEYQITKYDDNDLLIQNRNNTFVAISPNYHLELDGYIPIAVFTQNGGQLLDYGVALSFFTEWKGKDRVSDHDPDFVKDKTE